MLMTVAAYRKSELHSRQGKTTLTWPTVMWAMSKAMVPQKIWCVEI
jgi:hypothetical protein